MVLDLLQNPYDEKDDVLMKELMCLAHEFLQNFCLGNQQNQVLLHNHLDLFLNPGVSMSLNLFRDVPSIDMLLRDRSSRQRPSVPSSKTTWPCAMRSQTR